MTRFNVPWMTKLPPRADKFDSAKWPDWSARNGQAEFERRRRRGGALASLVFVALLYTKIVAVVRTPDHLLVKSTLILSVVLYAVAFMYAMVNGVRLGHRQRAYLFAVTLVLGIFPAIISGDVTDLSYLTYALAVAVMLLPLRVSRLIVIVVPGTLILAMWIIDGRVDWAQVWELLGAGIGMSSIFALLFTIQELREARSEIRTLAVAEERARLARDLHDILGHSLTTITVKAGLARRILEQGTDLPAAMAEVTDVEELGRQALADVRATVSNYRIASLPAEIAGARMSLQAARITPELPRAVDNVDAGLQEVFGYVVREAVTNVIRHSHADRCEVRLGDRWVEILDNGAANGADHDPGNGLRGLRERLSEVGGELTARPRASGGFRVLATVPAAESVPEGGKA